MADFRQLALDFVLEDNEANATKIAENAAKEIEKAPANSNPVARWVESVQPWMPGSGDDQVMRDANEVPDWTARAKALEFLSRTLDFLGPDVLKASQVQLLIAFFGAMFDVDHKAGIMASATALSRIVAMKSFRGSSGKDIIQKICALGDDFPRQIAKTRLAVYELLRSLLSMPPVAKDLQQDDANSQFMKNLLNLCQSERDPDCLIVWFDILRLFLAEYSPSKETMEEVYGTFKAYFPITLPRTAQSGVTPEELKQQLRKCFTSSHRLASLALPFLIGKLDQGDGVTVNVKVDVLRTIKACLETYEEPKESVIPYTSRIWTSLKYEVRNGEVEDSIWATLEVLKALTTRLEGDDLRDYTLDVTRDCVTDLGTAMYANAAGRLLISVLSAKPGAFVLMVAPTVTHIKENLRHPKSPTHNLDLLKILHVLLESRLLVTELVMTQQEHSDFAAVDGVFKSLYADVYQSHLQLGSKAEVYEDNVKMTTEAVQGVGALLCQRIVGASDGSSAALLIPESTCSDACNALFTIATRPWTEQDRHAGTDSLVNETTSSLQRIVQSHPQVFDGLVSRGMALVQHARGASTDDAADTGRSMISLLAFIGCSTLADRPEVTFSHFLRLLDVAVLELNASMNNQAGAQFWSSALEGIHSLMRYFNDACLTKSPDPAQSSREFSLARIVGDYPQLASIGDTTQESAAMDVDQGVVRLGSAKDAREDALLVGVLLCSRLYKNATTPDGTRLKLSGYLQSATRDERQYLYLLAELAGFLFREMDESQQAMLQVEKFAVNLFRDDIGLDQTASWDWLTASSLSTLSFGILEALRPSQVSKLYDGGIAQQILTECITPTTARTEPSVKPVKRSMIAVLANKHPIETLDSLMEAVEQTLSESLTKIKTCADDNEAEGLTDTILYIFSLASGLLRRHTGKASHKLLQTLQTVPADPRTGFHLGRRLEMIVAPQRFLTKEGFAVVRPLWLQKLYIQLVKPMLEAALGSGASPVGEPLVKAHFSVATLLMVKNLSFSIYEEDASNILRIAIGCAQNFGCSPDGMAALQVIKNILVEAPEQAQDHIRSLIKICTGIFTSKERLTTERPDWLPAAYTPSVRSPEIEAGCGKLSLEIVGGLPRMFESRHLLSYEPQVQRDLSTACGHRIRELRGTARLARGAWADVK